MQSQALVEQTSRHAVYLEGLKTRQVNQFSRYLNDIARSVRERLAGDELTEFGRARLERLLGSLEKDLRGIFDDYQGELAKDLQDLGEYEAGFEARSIENVLETSDFEPVIPDPAQVRAAYTAAPLSIRGYTGNKLLEPFISDWTDKEIQSVSGAIRQGYFEGQTNGQIQRAIRGTRANKYRDGLLAVTARNAEAVVRTSVQHVASIARMETWKENDDVVKGYRWLSTLDTRTTTQCRSLDNQFFRFGKGPVPPLHIRCRSTTVAELDGRMQLKAEGQRASMDGPVDAEQSYYEWLSKQPPEFQDSVLGPMRGKLLRDGGLTANQFARLQLDRNFEPLTLAEMRQREPLAFQRAFGQKPKPRPKKPSKPRTPPGITRPDTPAHNWNAVAFAGSRPAAAQVADKAADNLLVTSQPGGAWARGGKQINMPKNYQQGDVYAHGVWRHEFGHIVDVQNQRNMLEGYKSSDSDWLKVRDVTSKRLKDARGIGGRRGPKQALALRARDEAYADVEVFLARSEDRPAFLREAAKEAGVDGKELWRFLKAETNTFDGVDDIFAVSAHLGDQQRFARILKAIETGDLEGFLDDAVGRRTMAFNTAFESDTINRASTYENWTRRGTLGFMSDFGGAITKNKINSPRAGYPGHSDAYYRRRTAGPTEAFANAMEAYGHPNPFKWELLKKFAPEYCELFEEFIEGLQ